MIYISLLIITIVAIILVYIYKLNISNIFFCSITNSTNLLLIEIIGNKVGIYDEFV